MEENFLFNKEFLDKFKVESPKYFIGMDEYNGIYSYCLVQKFDNGNISVLLAKNFKFQHEWSDEITNLQKYFNATICK
jgi:hypothetical protein